MMEEGNVCSSEIYHIDLAFHFRSFAIMTLKIVIQDEARQCWDLDCPDACAAG